MREYEANTVMEVIYQLERRRSYYGLDQDQTMLKHLYGLHKLRDLEIYEHTYQVIIEPHAWGGEPPHPCIPTLLAMR